MFLYDKETAEAIMSRIMAFRMMHLPGRLVHELIPKAVEDIDAYQTFKDLENVVDYLNNSIDDFEELNLDSND